MKVGSHLDPSILSAEKLPLIPIEQIAGWSQNPSRSFGDLKNILQFLVIAP